MFLVCVCVGGGGGVGGEGRGVGGVCFSYSVLPLPVLLMPDSRPRPFFLPSPVNRETQNLYLSFSCVILWRFFSFFPFFSALLLLLASFDK